MKESWKEAKSAETGGLTSDGRGWEVAGPEANRLILKAFVPQ